MRFLLGLFLSTAAIASTLRTTEFEQSLNANAPRNYLKNSGAESDVRNVTDADAIVTRSTSSPMEGDGSFVIDADASGEKAIFTAKDLQGGLLGQSCEISGNYIGDGTLYKVYATLAGTTVSSETTLIDSGTSSQAFSLIFPCGASTTDDPALVIEATSASAASIKVDSLYLGEALNIGSVAQAEVVLRAQRSSSAQAVASTSFTKIQLNGSLYDPYSQFDSATNYRFTATRAGQFQIDYGAYLNAITAASTVQLFVYKNGAVDNNCGYFMPATTSGDFTYQGSCTISLAVGEYVELWVQSTDSSYNVNTSATFMHLTRFPTASETVLRGDAPGVGWTAFTPTLSWVSGISSNTAYYQCSNGNLSVRGKVVTSGAVTAALFTSNLPTGYTIDTSKIAFNTESSFGPASVLDFGVSGYGAETRYNSSTQVLVAIFNATSTYTIAAGVTNSVPMTFDASDEVQYSYTVPVTADSPCANNSPAFIPGSVYSDSGGIERSERIWFAGAASDTTSCTSDPCTIKYQSGSWATSVTRGGTGSYTINVASGIFSDKPTCVGSALNGANTVVVQALASSSTSISILTQDSITAGSVDAYLQVLCQGPH